MIYQQRPFLQEVKMDLEMRGKKGIIGFATSLPYPEFQIIFSHRAQRKIRDLWIPGRIASLILRLLTQAWTSCHIHPDARIEGGVLFPHALGIVVGANLVKSGAIIYQGVTIGSKETKGGTMDTRPRIGKNVVISAGAIILGDIDIEENSVIGANAVVLKNVPANSIAVGVPATVK